LSPGSHQDDVAADADTYGWLLVAVFPVVGVFIIGFICQIRPRAKRRQPVTPLPSVDAQADEEVDSSQFPVVDDEEHLEVQS
jgi:hypothetical protein